MVKYKSKEFGMKKQAKLDTSTYNNSHLIMMLPAQLKDQMQDVADARGITISKYVRDFVEETVYRGEMPIEIREDVDEKCSQKFVCRINRQVKGEAEKIYENDGLPIAAAVRMAMLDAVDIQGMPFEATYIDEREATQCQKNKRQ